MSTAVVTYCWSGLGRMGSAVRYRREYPTLAAAEASMTRVLEGRDEARQRVRCDDGQIRRLGTCDSAYMNEIVRRAVA